MVVLDKEQQEQTTKLKGKYAQKRKEVTADYEILYCKTLEKLYKEPPFREVDHLRSREAETTSEEDALRREAFELVHQAADALKSENTICVTKCDTASAVTKNDAPPYKDGRRSSTPSSVLNYHRQVANEEFVDLTTLPRLKYSEPAAEADENYGADAQHSLKKQRGEEPGTSAQLYDIPDIKVRVLQDRRVSDSAELTDRTSSRPKNPIRAVALLSPIEGTTYIPRTVSNRRRLPHFMNEDDDDDFDDFSSPDQKSRKRRRTSGRARRSKSNRTTLALTPSETLLSFGFNINFISYGPGSPSRSYPVTWNPGAGEATYRLQEIKGKPGRLCVYDGVESKAMSNQKMMIDNT
ncbi:hypothetical protein ACMFMF_001101 [Clarireedia jacksonii]